MYLPFYRIKGLGLRIKGFLQFSFSLNTYPLILIPSQKGFAVIPLIILMLFGIAAGTLLIQNNTSFLPKAAEPTEGYFDCLFKDLGTGPANSCKKITLHHCDQIRNSDGVVTDSLVVTNDLKKQLCIQGANNPGEGTTVKMYCYWDPPICPLTECNLAKVRLPGETEAQRRDVILRPTDGAREYCDTNNNMYEYTCGADGKITPVAKPDKKNECQTPAQVAPAAAPAAQPASQSAPETKDQCPQPAIDKCKKDHPKSTGCYIIDTRTRCIFPPEKDANYCTQGDIDHCRTPDDFREGCETKEATIVKTDGSKEPVKYTKCTPAKTGSAAGAPAAARTSSTLNQAAGARPAAGVAAPAAGATAARPAAGPEAARNGQTPTNVTNTTRPQGDISCGKDEKGVEIPCYTIGVFSPNELSQREAQTALASVNYGKFRSIIDEQESKIGTEIANKAREKIDAAEKEVKACLEKK